MDHPAAFPLAWLALAALACVSCWAPPVRSWLARRRYPLVIAAAVALAVRLPPALVPMPADAIVQWDVQSYRVVAEAVAERRDVYDLAGRYPYLPLHLYVFAGADRLSARAGVPYLAVVKLPAIIADALLAALVGASAAALGRRRSAAALAMAFALNPVSLLVTAYHGQFDAIPLSLTLAAWYLVAFRRGRWTVLPAALLLGLAIADKTWPVLVVPVLLWRLRGAMARAVFCVAAALPALAALRVYEHLVAGGAAHALRVVSGYQGVVGTWGYSELLVRTAGPAGHEDAVRRATAISFWVLIPALVCAYALAARLRRDPERMAVILAAVYAGAAGWGVHWLAWLIPAALIAGRRWGTCYLVAATAYATSIYIAFGGLYWAAVWVSGSLGPVAWSSTAGLAMWAGILLALSITAGVVLGRGRAGRRAPRRRPAPAGAPRRVPGGPRPATVGVDGAGPG